MNAAVNAFGFAATDLRLASCDAGAGDPGPRGSLTVGLDTVEGQPPEWVQLIPAGAFTGRDGGSWTLANPDAVIAMSEALRQSFGYCIDYDHALVDERAEAAPAAGWIVALENRAGSLWGRVEWTPPGAAAVVGKVYRGLSPVFMHDGAGTVIAFVNAGLTNNPNLTLAAINKARGLVPETPSMKSIATALGLAADATEAQIAACAAGFMALLTGLASALGVDAKVALAMNAASLKDAIVKAGGSETLAALAAKAGIQAGADAVTVETIALALNAQGRAAGVDLTKFVPMATYAAVAARAVSGEAESVDKLLQAAVNEGRILHAEIDALKPVGVASPDQLKAVIAARPVLKGLTTEIATRTAVNSAQGGLSEEERGVMTKLGLTEDEFKKARG